jgi:hypothetical protein
MVEFGISNGKQSTMRITQLVNQSVSQSQIFFQICVHGTHAMAAVSNVSRRSECLYFSLIFHDGIDQIPRSRSPIASPKDSLPQN